MTKLRPDELELLLELLDEDVVLDALEELEVLDEDEELDVLAEPDEVELLEFDELLEFEPGGSDGTDPSRSAGRATYRLVPEPLGSTE
jgi:hypothetical protein